MINTQFVNNCLLLNGKSYDEVDCIGVIRKALNIQCQGTNWLWRSYNNSSKYKYLVYRNNKIKVEDNLLPGSVVFKINWNVIPSGYDDKPNCYHIGVIGLKGNTVIHSSPSTGVREEKFSVFDWDAWGLMKQVEYTEHVPMNIVNDLSNMSDRQLLESIYMALYPID